MSFKIFVLTSALWCTIATIVLYIRENNEWVANFTTVQQQQQQEQSELISSKTRSTIVHNQPHWAYKLQFMPQPELIQQGKRICYVHVGKTAGSTVACYLGFDYDHCATGYNDTYSIAIPKTKTIRNAYNTLQQMIPYTTLHLPNYTTSTIHKSFDSCSEDNATSHYLFIVRHPLDRLASWFEYERISKNDPVNADTANDPNSAYSRIKPFFIDCNFQTLTELGGTRGLGGNNNTLCSRRAFRAVTGKFGYRVHNMYNYQYYYNTVLKLKQPKIPRIIVIRTEYIKNDWIGIEQKIFKTTNTSILNTIAIAHKNKTPKRYDDLFISNESKNNLCIALCNEIQYYKRILQNAENLSKEDYIQSMHELAQDCPNQVATPTCL